MTDSTEKKNISNKNLLLQYGAVGSQIFAGLVITVFVGKWVDGKLHFSFPVLIWLLPLIFLVSMILKVVKDTSKKNNE